MPKTFSGKLVVKFLCRDFGFCFISQKGSHVKLAKKRKTKKIITIVPPTQRVSLRDVERSAEISTDR